MVHVTLTIATYLLQLAIRVARLLASSECYDYWHLRDGVYRSKRGSPVGQHGVPTRLEWQCSKGVWDYHHTGDSWVTDL